VLGEGGRGKMTVKGSLGKLRKQQRLSVAAVLQEN
jgi:hypothetical protein